MTYDTDGLCEDTGTEGQPAREAGPAAPSTPDDSTPTQDPVTALATTDSHPPDNHNPDPAFPAHPHTTQAAQGMAAIGQIFARDLTAQDMLDSLRMALSQDGDGEALLFNQAQVLDTLFHRLTVNALSGVDKNGAPVPDYVDIERIHLLLRAQKQCRTTIEARNILRTKKARIEKNHEQKEGPLKWKE